MPLYGGMDLAGIIYAIKERFMKIAMLADADSLGNASFCERVRDFYRSEMEVIEKYEVTWWGLLWFVVSKGLVSVSLPALCERGEA